MFFFGWGGYLTGPLATCETGKGPQLLFFGGLMVLKYIDRDSSWDP